LGPKGLGRPFTARNRPFTACLATRRDAIDHTMKRLERLGERQVEQLELEQLGLREQQIPPTPEEMRIRKYNERMRARKAAVEKAADERARALKAEQARLEAQRVEEAKLLALKAKTEKEAAARAAKQKAAAEKAARGAEQAARVAGNDRRDSRESKEQDRTRTRGSKEAMRIPCN
jgi:hypothetical protein